MKSGPKLFVIISLAAIAAAAALVYASTWSDAFVADDWLHLMHSKNLTFSTFARNWSFVPEDKYYRPVSIGYFWLNYALWGLEPTGHHVVKGLLFAATAALLFIFVLRATGLKIAALAAGLIFALHPINASCAIWLATHANVLCAFFYLLALVLFVEVRKRERFNFLLYAAFFLSMLLCFGSYELGYTLPAALILTEILLLWRKTGESAGSYWKKAWRAHVPYLVVVAAFFVLRFVYMGMGKIESPAETPEGEVRTLPIIMTAFMPVGVMDSGIPYWVRPLPTVAGLAFFAAALIFGKGLRRTAIFGAVMGVAGVTPVLGAINNVPDFGNTRYLIISMAGFGILVGCCVSLLWQWRIARVTGAVFLAALLVVYGWLDFGWKEKWSLAAAQSASIVDTVTEACRGAQFPFRLVFVNYPTIHGVFYTEPIYLPQALLARLDTLIIDEDLQSKSPYIKSLNYYRQQNPAVVEKIKRWLPIRLDSLDLYEHGIFRPDEKIYRISDGDLPQTFFFYWDEGEQRLVDCTEQMRKRLDERARRRPAKLFEWSAPEPLVVGRSPGCIEVGGAELRQSAEDGALYISPSPGQREPAVLLVHLDGIDCGDFDQVEIDLSAASKTWREGYFTASVAWRHEGERESVEMIRRAVKFSGEYHAFYETHHYYRVPLAQKLLDCNGRVSAVSIILPPFINEYALKGIRLSRFDE